MRSLRPTTLRVSTAAVLPARPTAPLCNASSESALPDLKRIVRPDRAVRPALVPCSDETRLDQAEGDLADDILWHGSTVATGCQLQVGRSPSPFAGSVSVTQATMGRKLASPCVPSTLAQSKTLSPKSWGTNALQSVCGRTTSSTEALLARGQATRKRELTPVRVSSTIMRADDLDQASRQPKR